MLRVQVDRGFGRPDGIPGVPTQAPGPAAAPSTSIPTAPTGDERPLDVARQRAIAAAANLTRREALIAFLASTFDARSTDWPRGDTVRVIRDRAVAVENAVAKAHLLGWNKSGGGYQIPLDYADAKLTSHDLRGERFRKEDLTTALRVGHAAAGTDAVAHRKMKELAEYCAFAKRWLEDPDADPKLRRKFDDLTTQQFIERLKKKKKTAKSEEKAEGKKRRHSPDVGDSDDLDGSGGTAAELSDAEVKVKKSKKRAGKKARRASSDSGS
ncbi:hypothetical protein B0H16DRAFT_1798140 [Mycena metata]|uniref:Uncharacterized protein n=1 Tax=Mycena metata TaxID=1033252 RepID=A0AAD7JH71_9AGAR|nr:hypothetical protein B0H16DRAFT_1798140 [Mycena metata]